MYVKKAVPYRQTDKAWTYMVVSKERRLSFDANALTQDIQLCRDKVYLNYIYNGHHLQAGIPPQINRENLRSKSQGTATEFKVN